MLIIKDSVTNSYNDKFKNEDSMFELDKDVDRGFRTSVKNKQPNLALLYLSEVLSKIDERLTKLEEALSNPPTVTSEATEGDQTVEKTPKPTSKKAAAKKAASKKEETEEPSNEEN